MRMERLAVPMSHSTEKLFRRYAQIHDVDLCVVAKEAVTRYCKEIPPQHELISAQENQMRKFISMPDTAMRLLELWSDNTRISKVKLVEWAIRKLVQDQEKEQEKEEDNEE